MKRASILMLAALAAMLFVTSPGAQTRRTGPEVKRGTPPITRSLDRGEIATPLRSTILNDTTVIGFWDFGTAGACDAQGWTSHDVTEQTGDYMHVDDFAGLGGNYAPLEGAQSMWCGARASASDPALCSYAYLPGYGPSWDQALCMTSCEPVTGDVTVSYWLMTHIIDAGWDFVTLEADTSCGDLWDIVLMERSGVYLQLFESVVLPDSMHSGQVKFRFRFTSDGAWDDHDVLDSDGAFILDSLTVSDGGGVVLATEDFESEAVGANATLSGNWESCPAPGFGDFAGLFPGGGVLQRVDCGGTISCVWGFFAGSTANYSCGGYPGEPAIPDENEQGVSIWNEVWSPVISLSGIGSNLEFHARRYMDFAPSVAGPHTFRTYRIRSKVGICWTAWSYFNSTVYYVPYLGWGTDVASIDGHIQPGATDIQIAMGVLDLSSIFAGIGGCNSNAPLFDSAALVQVDYIGAQWQVRSDHLFQDSFAGDGTTTGTVRADIAADILPVGGPNLLPGDSAVVTAFDDVAGLDTDGTYGGAAVYAYVGVWPQGQAGKDGPAISGDVSRFPLVDSLTHGGDTWYCLRMDTVFSGGNPVDDRFCVDLNDNLFTPGDTVCFAFCAISNGGDQSYWTEHTGVTDVLAQALDNPGEFTCLPTLDENDGAYQILYVDAADGRGAQPHFDAAFAELGIAAQVDRYDVRAVLGDYGNTPAGRVTDAVTQLADVYEMIIWSTSDVNNGILGDGFNAKADDAFMLYEYLDNLCHGGLWLTGDHIAQWITGLGGTSGPALRSQIEYTVDYSNHQDAGLDLSPLVVAEPLSCFDEPTADSLVAFGGCPNINRFDVISAAGTATLEASYVSGAITGGASVKQQNVNGICVPTGMGNQPYATVIIEGYGFETVQNDVPAGITDAAKHLDDIIHCIYLTPTPVRTVQGPRNALAQNVPNPFNPTTTIRFEVARRGRVAVRVYNVAGQLVRTLLDEERAPGFVHEIVWDGLNDRNQSVASGVYFYRLTTRDYQQTRKMVLLK